MLFGWLIPLVIVMFNLCFEYENYGGDYHCWLQMDTNLIYGQFVPIAFMTIISLAIIEAAGEGAGSKKLQNVNEQQRKTAKIMQRTLVLILPTVRILTYLSKLSPLLVKATKIEKIFTVDLTLCSKCQIDDEDFIDFCSLLRKHYDVTKEFC
jgi:hypothetical protein